MTNIEYFIKSVASLIKEERKHSEIDIPFMSQQMNISDSYYRHLERASTMQVSLHRYAKMTQLISIPLSSVIEAVENNRKKIDKGYYPKLSHCYSIDDYIVELGKVIRSIRKDLGKSQTNISDKLGFTYYYFGHIEQGKRLTISLYRYKEIATALDTPLHVILQQVENNLGIN